MDREAIEEIFNNFDQGGKGYLRKDELSLLCQSSPFNEAEIDQLFHTIDSNSDGKIEKEEFVHSFIEVIGKFQKGSDQELKSPPPHHQQEMSVDEMGMTSTPKRSLEKISPIKNETTRFVPTPTWEDFTSSVGSNIYTLFSYERIQDFFKKIEGSKQSDVVVDKFESMMRSLMKEFNGLQTEITSLKDSLEKEQEKTENQISVLAEEMDAQIAAKERSARDEERKIVEEKLRGDREKYEKRIEELQDAVTKLRKIDEKLSSSSPLQTENDRLRERVRQIMEENATLSFNLNERDTRILVLESQVSTLNVELQEKHIEVQRENEAAEFALAERDNMSRQLSSICSDNRKLRDFNDEVRQSMSSRLLANQQQQQNISRSMVSLNNSPAPEQNSIYNSNINNCLMETDEFAECDPSFSHHSRESSRLYGVDDDDVTVGTDVSSLVDSSRRNYDKDSGVGTLRGDQNESDNTEGTGYSRPRSTTKRTKNRYSRSPVPPKMKFSRASLHRRNHSVSPAPSHPQFLPTDETASVGRRGVRTSVRYNQRRTSNTASMKEFYTHNGDYSSDTTDDVTLPSRCGSRANGNISSSPSERTFDSRSSRRKVVPGYLPDNGAYEQPHITTKTRLFKIILCGDANTGKSSFSLRFCKDEFLVKTRSTLGVDFRLRTIHVEHSRPVTLQIWDTAGQERFRSLSINYFRRADGVVLMYDVSNTQSFLNVREWMDSIVDSVPPGTPVLICANKIDLRTRLKQEQKEFVSSSDGAQLASSYGVFFMETSAASGDNVENAMLSLARHLKERTEEERNDIKRLTPVAKPQHSCCNRVN